MTWKKKMIQYLNLWKKKMASLFWLDDCAWGICLRERKWKIELLCVLDKHGGFMLPKWRLKKWESFEDAAVREFQEETGIYNAKISKEIGIIRDRIRRKKIVLFSFLWTSFSHSSIHDEAIMWVDIKTACKKMKHPSERDFLKKYFPIQ